MKMRVQVKYLKSGKIDFVFIRINFCGNIFCERVFAIWRKNRKRKFPLLSWYFKNDYLIHLNQYHHHRDKVYLFETSGRFKKTNRKNSKTFQECHLEGVAYKVRQYWKIQKRNNNFDSLF